MLEKMFRTIHIEGLDLAGKSTISKFIAKTQGFELRNNSLLPIGRNPFVIKADQLRKIGAVGNANIGEIYLDALKYDIVEYNNVANGTTIVQDSTIIIRSIAYHTVYGNNELAEEFRALLPMHPRFNVSCLLTASDVVRKMRLRGRISRHNDNPEDYLIYSDPEKFYAMENIIKEIILNEFNGVIIDSSMLEQEGEKERITDMILEKSEMSH